LEVTPQDLFVRTVSGNLFKSESGSHSAAMDQG
jgi:hypothetical protein